MIKGCVDPDHYGDNYCDDVNNNEACFFDGGDCCGGIIHPFYCTECLCLEEGGTTTSSSITTAGCNFYIGDGFCDDINNNLACDYDGGDCCGSDVKTQFCTECLCLE